MEYDNTCLNYMLIIIVSRKHRQHMTAALRFTQKETKWYQDRLSPPPNHTAPFLHISLAAL